MIDLVESETHREAIKLIEKRIALPLGYKEFNPPSKSDQIIIQLNNTIIAFLLQLQHKIDKNFTEKLESKNIDTTGIEELIEKLNKIEITPQKEKIIKKQKKWIFFQQDQEKKDQDQVTPRI